MLHYYPLKELGKVIECQRPGRQFECVGMTVKSCGGLLTFGNFQILMKTTVP